MARHGGRRRSQVEWLCHDGSGFVEKRDLLVQEIDDAAVHVFMNGHCHSLAIALHRMTGAPLLLCESSENGCEEWWHTGVEHDGHWVDIRGNAPIQPRELHRFVVGGPRPVRFKSVVEDFFYDLWHKNLMFKPEPDKARPWAQLVAQRERMM